MFFFKFSYWTFTITSSQISLNAGIIQRDYYCPRISNIYVQFKNIANTRPIIKYECTTISGGETIKQINQQSGAHCELDRRATSSTPGSDKTFVIRGSPDQVENCKRIISDKVQMLLNFVCTSGGNVPQTATYPGMAPQGYNPQGWGGGGYQQNWQPPAQQQDNGKIILNFTVLYYLFIFINKYTFLAFTINE